MNKFKRVTSMLLALVMVFSLSMSVFAEETNAGITLTIDKQSVAIGETVTVTLGVDKEISGIFALGLKLYADNTVFDVVSVETDFTKNDQLANQGWIKMATYSTSGNNLTISGNFATVVLKAKKAVDNTSIYINDVQAVKTGVADSEKIVTVNIPDALTPTVTETAPTPFTGYAVYGGTDVSAVTDGVVTVDLKVTHSDEKVKTYNAYDVTVRYNAEELQFMSYTAPEGDVNHAKYTNSVSGAEGVLQFAGFGENKGFEKSVGRLVFKVLKSNGEAAITIDQAKIDSKAGAIEESAPEVEIAGGEDNTADTIVVKVAHKVTKPDFVTGETVVAPGGDYTFGYADTENYTYSNLKVTVGGTEVTPTKNADGTYTITNIDGEVVITVTQTANSYDVTFKQVDSVTYDGAEKATYGTDYTVTVTTSKTGHKIGTVTAKIGDETVTLTSGENNQYVLEGNEIKAAVEITATVMDAGTHTLVKFTGNGAEDVAGGTEQTAEIGKEFKFKLKDTAAADCVYTVTIGEEELTADTNGEYTIAKEKVTKDGVTVTVTKVLKVEDTIFVSEYITLGATEEAEGQKIYLVTATNNDKVLSYGENTMFWSAKYNGGKGAYCWLVISDKSIDEMKAEAETAITVAAEGKTATQVAYDMDVNQSKGDADINDAQLIYDMYTAEYDSFDNVSMDKFLEADVNGDTKVDTTDAVAIVNRILGI